MKSHFVQTELPFTTPAEASAPAHQTAARLDWPLQPLPAATVRELSRLSARWSRGHSRRRVGAGRIHADQPA